MRSNHFWLLLAGLWVTNPAYSSCHLAEQTWASLPHVSARPSREGLTVKVSGIVSSDAQLWDVAHEQARTLDLNHPNLLTAGNYHWLQVFGQWQDCQTHMATAYYDAKPDHAPRAMLNLAKPTLAIMPVELPREHRHYRGTETWVFEVSQSGHPLVHHDVYFWDNFGQKQQLITDELGRIHLTFPSYTTDHEQDNHTTSPRRTSRQFAIWLMSDDEQQASGFDYRYTPNPDNQRVLWLGILIILASMIVTTISLVRFKKPKKHQITTKEST